VKKNRSDPAKSGGWYGSTKSQREVLQGKISRRITRRFLGRRGGKHEAMIAESDLEVLGPSQQGLQLKTTDRVERATWRHFGLAGSRCWKEKVGGGASGPEGSGGSRKKSMGRFVTFRNCGRGKKGAAR